MNTASRKADLQLAGIVLVLALAALATPAQAVDPGAPFAAPRQIDQILGVDRGGALGTITALTQDGFVQNGTNVLTGGALVLRDGQPATQSVLQVGQLVFVLGNFAGGQVGATAREVVLDHRLRGAIDTVDLQANSLIALGQTVRVNADTVVAGVTGASSLEDLVSGDFLLVSGYLGADGAISATRVETAAPETYSIEGYVSELDLENDTLSINAQPVDFSAAILSGFPGGMPTDGDYVEITASTLTPAGVLVASDVGLDEDGLGLIAGDYVEVEGLVTGINASDEFQLGMQVVRSDEQTEFENGSAADIAVDALLEISGTVDADGAILAAQIEFISPSNTLVIADVQVVNAGHGFVMALGVKIEITVETQLEDDSALDLQPFDLHNISPGDRVVVRGVHVPAIPGHVVATRLVRERPAVEVSLEGPTTVFVPQNAEISVVGVRILADFSNPDIVEFFQSPRGGSRVEAQGIQVGYSTLFAQELQWMDDPEANLARHETRAEGRPRAR